MKILNLFLANTRAFLDINGLTDLTHCSFSEEHGAFLKLDKKWGLRPYPN